MNMRRKMKTIKALLMGYILFRVNDKFYITYGRAYKAKEKIAGSVSFDGFNLRKFDWECFYLRVSIDK